jgi:hypothetical protein
VFADLVCEGRDTRVFDGDLVEQFEAVDQAQGLPVLLDYTEPVQRVQGVRPLVNTSFDFVLDNSAKVVVDAGQYRDIVLSPQLVQDGRDLDGREEILAEVSVLLISTHKSTVLQAHEMMDELMLFW